MTVLLFFNTVQDTVSSVLDRADLETNTGFLTWKKIHLNLKSKIDKIRVEYI